MRCPAAATALIALCVLAISAAAAVQQPNQLNSRADAFRALIVSPGNVLAHYSQHHMDYCNECDFDLYKVLLPMLGCCNAPSSAFLLGGLNEGALADVLLEACPATQVHGFEISHKLYERLVLKYAGRRGGVRVNNLGMSSKAGTSRVTLFGDTHAGSGFYASYGDQARWDGVTTVETVRLADYVAAEGLGGRVCMAIADVEGHEPAVLQGMELERHAADFPLIAIELGGTWIDSRRTSSWTFADAAAYLTALDYSLYLMGSKTLLPVTVDFFLQCRELNQGYTSSNVLAVHASAGL